MDDGMYIFPLLFVVGLPLIVFEDRFIFRFASLLSSLSCHLLLISLFLFLRQRY